jgi:hypothetical protein
MEFAIQYVKGVLCATLTMRHMQGIAVRLVPLESICHVKIMIWQALFIADRTPFEARDD